MHQFYAYYENMDDNKQVVKMIQIDSLLALTEEQATIEAVKKAFDLKQENESFTMLETIAIC